MLLIHPPQVRNCEPPVALGRLAGALEAAGEPVTLLDGALEGFLWLCDQPPVSPEDSKSLLIRRKKDSYLTFPEKSHTFEEYKKQIAHIRYLASSAEPAASRNILVSPANYQDPSLSPLNSEDLIDSWEHPEKNLFSPWFTERISTLLKEGNHKTAAVSLGYLSQALTGAAICGYIKKTFPEIRLQLGGGLINSWARGPSDISFLEKMADSIHAGVGEEEIVRFAGKEWKGEGLPSYSGLYDRPFGRNYLSFGRILPYAASLGCSWKRCTFCSELWENNPYCELSPEKAALELQTLTEKYEPALIHLCDSEISRELMQKIQHLPPGAPWYGFSRFLPEMTGAAYCRKLAASGCRMLCLGLESGDQGVLNSLKKGIRTDQVRTILSNLKDAGIGTYVYIMFGTPAEDREKAFRTRDYILENSGNIDFLNVSIFNMPIGSDEAKEMAKTQFYDGDLSLYSEFRHHEGWNRREVRNFLDAEFRRIPEIRRVLNRTPPVFTANHAPFFLS